MDDNINSIRQFLCEFQEADIEENVKYRSNIISSYYMNPEDVKAEVLDWSLHYLEQKNCPYSLALILAKVVAHKLSDSIYEMSLQAEEGIDEDDDKRFRYESSLLYTEMIECLSEACTNWQDHVDINDIKVEPPPHVVSSFAIKNTRRKMEDRHVIIHDLNAVCGLKDVPQHSYYAIFDGHAGVEAASYCAAHLHWNIINHPEFLTNTEKAISEAVAVTDRNLLERLYREGIKGGCTALCCLIRDKIMYVAWVGDSQAVLVKQGIPVPIGLPHKPDREDERCRIEELGGCILFLGTWRVNGTLAVSRALGDAEHKPYISSEPEVLKIPLDGSEDYIVLACDGLWDQLHPSDVGQVVYNHIVECAESVEKVASKLVQLSKSHGSTDNITAIIVFLKDPLNISKSDQVFPQLQNKNEEMHSKIDTTNPSDTLNSEKIIETAVNTTDCAINGVTITEQFKNECNSLNFYQNTTEPVVLSHVQEKTVSSETFMDQFDHSSISPASLIYENPLLQNYCNRDIMLNYTQSIPTSLPNSLNSSGNQSNDYDLSECITLDAQQQNNQNIIENVPNTLTNLLNSTNICTKDTANLNQLVTISTVHDVEQPDTINLLEVTVESKSTEQSDEVSITKNDLIVLEEKSESSNEVEMQPITNLQLDSTSLLPDVHKDKIIPLTKEVDQRASKNTTEISDFQMSESSYKMSSVISTSSDSNMDHTDSLCNTFSSVARTSNFATEIEISNKLSDSRYEENSYKQEALPSLTLENYFNVIDNKLNLYDDDKVTNNNNFHSTTEDSITDLDKKKSLYPIGMLNFEKNDKVTEFPLTHDCSTANALDMHNKINDVSVADILQTENKAITNVSNKSTCSTNETEPDNLETRVELISKKCTNIRDAELNLCSETSEMTLTQNFQLETKTSELICPTASHVENKLKENEASNSNLHKENLLLCSTDTPGFNKIESVCELPLLQNCEDAIVDKLTISNKVGNTVINNLYPEISNNGIEDKSNFPLHSIDETIITSKLSETKLSSENYASITNDNSNGTTTENNIRSETEVCNLNLNEGSSSLPSIDLSDFNKYEAGSELPSKDCTNITGDKVDMHKHINVINVNEPNSNTFPTLSLKNTSEASISANLEDTNTVLNGHKNTDIFLSTQSPTKNDITENKILINNNEDTNRVSPSFRDMTCAESPSKGQAVDELQIRDDLRQPKCDQAEKIPIFENSVNQVSNEIKNVQTTKDNTKCIASVRGNARHPSPQTKKLVKSDNNNKIISTKTSTIKESIATSSNLGKRKPIAPKLTKSSLLKPMQAQLKIKEIALDKDKTECEPKVKSSHTKPNVFERLSSPKGTFTKPKENRNKEILFSSKIISGTITKTFPDARTSSNFSQSNKTLGAVSKRMNIQPSVSENMSKTRTPTAINNKLNTKTHRPLLSNQVANKTQRENLSQKTDGKQQELSNIKKKPSSTLDTSDIKKSCSANRQDTVKQRSPYGIKVAERVLVNTSSRQATPFKSNVSTKLDIKQASVTPTQSCNSKLVSARNMRAVMERSSISSTKLKEEKTSTIKYAGVQKKDSNAPAKVGKTSHIQKSTISNHKKSNVLNMDGQGDCVITNKDNPLPEINGKHIELPKSNTSNSREVPNPNLIG